MERLAAFRISAAWYQFNLGDSAAERCPLISKTDKPMPGVFGSLEEGYITNGNAAFFCTCAHLNVHWAELFRSDHVPDFGATERVIAVLLDIQSGEVVITTNQLDGSAFLTPGVYTTYVLGFSLGRDHVTEIPNPDDWPKGSRSDAELAALTSYEHYQIIFG